MACKNQIETGIGQRIRRFLPMIYFRISDQLHHGRTRQHRVMRHCKNKIPTLLGIRNLAENPLHLLRVKAGKALAIPIAVER